MDVTAPSNGSLASSPETYHQAKKRMLDAWQTSYLRDLLVSTGGNISAAARRAGLGRAQLRRLARMHNVDPRFRPGGQSRGESEA